MYKLITILLLFCVTLIGCKKEKNSKKDSVKYTEFQPTLKVTSVDTIVAHGSGCGYVVLPTDTAASISIDINSDGVDDFKLECGSWYSFVSNSNPCANYNKNITITGYSNDNSVAVKDEYNVASTFEVNAVINNSQKWNNNAMLMLLATQAPFTTNFTGNKYIGLRMQMGENIHFAWLYLNKTDYTITVISSAINQTVGNSIRTGQKE